MPAEKSEPLMANKGDMGGLRGPQPKTMQSSRGREGPRPVELLVLVLYRPAQDMGALRILGERGGGRSSAQHPTQIHRKPLLLEKEEALRTCVWLVPESGLSRSL